jgi:hypothetical protein
LDINLLDRDDTKELLKLYGQPIENDAKRKLDQGMIDERTYQLIVRRALKSEEKLND